MSPLDRARLYLKNCPPCISGARGHDLFRQISCSVIHGFDLSESEASVVFDEWNRTCDPEWSDREVDHKIQEAFACEDIKGRPRGYLLKEGRVKVEFNPQNHKTTKPQLNPFRTTKAFNVAEWRVSSLALHGAEILSCLGDRSIAEIKAVSPSPLPDPNDQDENFEFYLALYEREPDLVWMGLVDDSGSEHHAKNFQVVDRWSNQGFPQGALFTTGCTFKPGTISRCKDQRSVVKFAIAESDRISEPLEGKSLEEIERIKEANYRRQCAIFFFLKDTLKLKIRMVVNTMGVSLHIWIDITGLSEDYARHLQTLLCGLHDGLEDFGPKKRRKYKGGMGCDPSTFRMSQPARLPGGIRPPNPTEGKAGGVQHIIYLDLK